jgi:putative SOS response-associated peptidase YedK
MCGRFTLTTADVAALARRWAAELDEAVARGWRPRFNVAPGDPHLVLRARGGRRRLERATFGLPGPAPRPPAPSGRAALGMSGPRDPHAILRINARVESAAEKPAFRDAWRGRRCAVPADGFIEWTGPASARRPSWLHPPDGAPLLFAGLWGATAGGGIAFAILTADANAEVRALHDRMPVLLPEPLLAAWLSDGPAPALPAPADGVLAVRRISPRVSSPRNDDPECLEPLPPERQLALKLG